VRKGFPYRLTDAKEPRDEAAAHVAVSNFGLVYIYMEALDEAYLKNHSMVAHSVRHKN